MLVKELIEILQKVDPNSMVSVWDTYYDDATFDVHVAQWNDENSLNSHVHIGSAVFGKLVN
jgi:hypothetical protein